MEGQIKKPKIDNNIFSEIAKFKFIKNIVTDSSSFSRTGFCLIKSLDNISYLVYIQSKILYFLI